MIFADIDKNLIQNIQNNLKKLDKAVIDFSQVDENGAVAVGKLLIQKPHFFRCNYYPPHPLLIIGGKKYISIYDYEMETVTRVDSEENIMGILFRDNWTNNKNFKIVETKAYDEYFVVKILYLANEQQNELFFSKKSFDLIKINIFEMGEMSVVINFSEPLLVKGFKPGIFEMRSPAVFGKPSQFNEKDIREQYDVN
jgi:hypothetical protein